MYVDIDLLNQNHEKRIDKLHINFSFFELFFPKNLQNFQIVL